MKKILVFAFLLLLSATGIAYSQTYILPPSPNASSLVRYGEYPVSLSTGVPNISVPIYTVDIDGFSLPLSISYHASGVRAGDIASSVGLGWALNAGGAITRSIEGRADFNDYWDMSHADTVYMRQSTLEASIDNMRSHGAGYVLLDDIIGRGNESTYDLSSDRYSFNFADKCGIMRYSFTDNMFVPLNYNTFTVERTRAGDYTGFIVLDADGTVYRFDAPEWTGVADDENKTNITTWYLTNVTTLSGDSISIEYERARNFHSYLYGDCVKVGTWAGDNDDLIQGARVMASGPSIHIVHRPLVVKRISWKGNRADFRYANDRRDICPTRLTGLDIINCEGDTLKSVRLYHGYHGNTDGDRRMMLDSINVTGCGTYSFEYDRSFTLPAYPGMSGTYSGKRIDYWGYFNNKDDYLIPSEAVVKAARELGFQNPASYASRYADRTPDFTYAKAGTLTSVTYPTGGVSTFEYEANCAGTGGIRIRRITDSAGAGAPPMTKAYSYGAPLYNSNITDRYLYPGSHGVQINLQGISYYDEYTCVGMPMTPLTLESGANVFYSSISETSADGSRIEYEYDYGAYRNVRGLDSWTDPRLSEYETYDEGNVPPLLKEKKVYGPDGACVSSTVNTYDNIRVKEFPVGVRLVVNAWSDEDMLPSDLDYMQPGSLMTAGVNAVSKVATLSSTVITDFTTGMSTTVSYEYQDLDKTLRPHAVTIDNGDGQPLKRVSTFVYEDADPVSTLMSSPGYGITDVVTGTSTYRGDQLAQRIRTRYAVRNQYGFIPTATYGSIGTGNEHELIRLEDFDEHGRARLMVENGCDSIRIAWGYMGMYPLSVTRGHLRTEFEYRPLFGVTRAKTPSGYALEYEYGDGGRLLKISDPRGTLKEYGYTPTSVTEHSYVTESQTVMSVLRLDGLGRPCQNFTTAPGGNMLMQCTAYDCLGREAKAWLPVVCNDTLFKSTEQVEALAAATYTGESTPYRLMSYDAFGRPTFTTTPGDEFGGRGVARSYGTNAHGSVKRYYAPVDRISMVKGGYWPEGTLVSETVTDEDGLTVETFRDKEGRTVLERRAGHSDTYYVYNVYGQLRYVLSPQYQEYGYKAVYGHEYRYDDRGRTVKCIAPGCEATRLKYNDGSNRVAYTQDGVQRQDGSYTYYKYDTAARLTEVGKCTSADGSYTNAIPGIRNFYDDYSWAPGHVSGAEPDSMAYGLLTGCEKTLSDGTILSEKYLYDDKERLSLTVTQYPDGRTTSNTAEYNYDSSLWKTMFEDPASGLAVTDEHAYYTASGALMRSTITSSLDHMTRVLRRYRDITYDSLGRIVRVSTELPEPEPFEYSYDIRGNVKTISGPGYSSELHYTDGPGTPRYNGLISSMSWTGDGDNLPRVYTYVYDQLGRLTKAVYAEGEDLSRHVNRYNEEVLEYSANSMPKRMQRRGLKQDMEYGKVDNLHIYLDGNRIQSVADDADPVVRAGAMDFEDGADYNVEYDYDACGRLVRDDNKGIELIRYDHYGNPAEICFAGGNRTRYVYTPDGVKVRTVHLTALTPVTVPLAEASAYSKDSTEYLGPMIVENGAPSRYLFDGGYILYANGGANPAIRLYTKDHIGNIRAVSTGSGSVVQVSHYYPFGGIFADAATGQDMQPLRYNGNELDRMHGLDTYDYGFRQYDPLLTVWNRPDPLSHLSYNVSPYCYCNANPVNYADCLGLFATRQEAWEYCIQNGWSTECIHMNRCFEDVRNTNMRFFVSLGPDGLPYRSGDTLWRYFGADSGGSSAYSNSSIWGAMAYAEGGGTYSSGGYVNHKGNRQDMMSAIQMGVSATSVPFAFKQTITDAYALSATRTSLTEYKSLPTAGKKTLMKKVYGDGVSKYLRINKNISSGFTYVGLGLSIYNVINEYNAGNRYTALSMVLVGGITYFSNSIPLFGTAISVGLGCTDAFYGEKFYDYIRETYDKN